MPPHHEAVQPTWDRLSPRVPVLTRAHRMAVTSPTPCIRNETGMRDAAAALLRKTRRWLLPRRSGARAVL